ncbi:hypothetical protein D9M70_545090 [compost metagenome]
MPAPARRLISITLLSPAINFSLSSCFSLGDSLPVYITGLNSASFSFQMPYTSRCQPKSITCWPLSTSNRTNSAT